MHVKLLHVHTHQFNLDANDDAVKTHEEIVINALARALVALKREGQKNA